MNNVAICRRNDQSRFHALIASHVVILHPLTLSDIDTNDKIDKNGTNGLSFNV